MAGTGREKYHRGLATNVSLNGSELSLYDSSAYICWDTNHHFCCGKNRVTRTSHGPWLYTAPISTPVFDIFTPFLRAAALASRTDINNAPRRPVLLFEV